jgi:hypothetical protein
MSTRDLVNAMADGRSVDIESAFNSCVAERVAGKLQQMKVDVAQTMFNSQQEEAPVEE